MSKQPGVVSSIFQTHLLWFAQPFQPVLLSIWRSVMQPLTDNGSLSEITASLMGDRQGYVSHICLYSCTNVAACTVCLCVFQYMWLCVYCMWPPNWCISVLINMQLSGAPQEVRECAAVSMALYQQMKIKKQAHTHIHTRRTVPWLTYNTFPGNLASNNLKLFEVCVYLKIWRFFFLSP